MEYWLHYTCFDIYTYCLLMHSNYMLQYIWIYVFFMACIDMVLMYTELILEIVLLQSAFMSYKITCNIKKKSLCVCVLFLTNEYNCIMIWQGQSWKHWLCSHRFYVQWRDEIDLNVQPECCRPISCLVVSKVEDKAKSLYVIYG